MRPTIVLIHGAYGGAVISNVAAATAELILEAAALPAAI
jgi:hypothetical protein